jgi:hypothetical protein
MSAYAPLDNTRDAFVTFKSSKPAQECYHPGPYRPSATLCALRSFAILLVIVFTSTHPKARA